MADIALLMWPLVALFFFATLGREKGLIWTVVGGYLLLPNGHSFDLPALPDYTKTSATASSAFVGWFFYRNRASWPSDTDLPVRIDSLVLAQLGLVSIFCASALATLLNNGEPLIYGDSERTGLVAWDWINMVTDPLIPAAIGFLGWLCLRSPRHHEELLKVIVILAFFYSLGALYEMRMSPQINRMVYGYFPHSWTQHIRGGSFRPIMFLDHGLSLAFFLLTGALAALGLFRAKRGGFLRIAYLGIGLWILAVLLITPNLGGALLTFLFAPLVLLAPRSIQVRAAVVVSVVFLSFPLIRQSIPLDGFVEYITGISEERAGSFQYRLENENDMLARANEKPMFGWGGWGRWRVFDERGRDTTTADGTWIIFFGERGWFGYLSFFTIIALPVFLLSRARRHKEMSAATATIAMIGAANLIYIVPNSTFTPVSWLLAGAIAGFVSWRPASNAIEGTTPTPPSSDSRYTRFAHDQIEPVSLRRNHQIRSRT